jgi:ssDNA-binding Zn-finger/Zn-ribbon topoisomerase 1
MKKQLCPKCNYEWTAKVERPKRCPLCGKWLIKMILSTVK